MVVPISSIQPRILVAPLDWGLGHATRCIPIIHQLIAADCTVLLAGDGRGEALLRTEFPQLQFLKLKGYDISYGKTGWELVGKLLLQIPKIIEAMDEEHEWLKGAIEEYKIDAVISDNRYGLFNEAVYSVFITHQLLIKTSLGTMADELLQKLNYEYVNAFNECWVPDVQGEPNLAGDLSHPLKPPAVPVRYLGTLSRMKRAEPDTEGKSLLIILSGPEPQRSLLEEMLLEQLEKYTLPVVFIRGLPGEVNVPPVPENIQIINHLPAQELQTIIEAAEVIISRCGYSTVMDLMTLQKKSILIPTPGQTEQEYLARHLMQHNLALCIPQAKFRLLNALQLAESFNYRLVNFSNEGALKQAVESLIEKLNDKRNTDSNQPVSEL